MTARHWDLWPGYPDGEVEALVARAEAASDERLALEALARAPDTLPAHLLLARLRRPGPDYLVHLDRLHELLRPRVYVEIGVAEGESLALARPGCRALGIDPTPRLRDHFRLAESARVVRRTSDAFFAEASDDLAFELAFLDGDHAFAQVLRDFVNLERHAAPGAVLAIHDTLPLDEATAAPARRTTFYSGTVWKLRLILARLRPELDVRTIAAAPTGLTLVRGLRPGPTPLSERVTEILALAETWTWDDYLRFQAGDTTVPSSPRTVDALLGVHSGRFDGLRHGYVLTGSVVAARGVRAVPLTVTANGEALGTTLANLIVATEDGGRAHRLAFEHALRLTELDGKPRRYAVSTTAGVPVAELTAAAAPDKPYHDPPSLLAWAFHHRVVPAPWTDVDKNCLAYFDWLADRPRAAPGPLVTVIMPCHDMRATLGAAIASVIAQTYPRWELLVVDDGSHDAPGEGVAAFADPRVRLLATGGPRGPAAARNTALAAARGEIVAYLDADNRWDPRYLAVMVDALTPEWEAAYCGQYLHRDDEAVPFAARLGPYNPALLDNENYVDLNCLIHRRAAGERAGGFDPELRRLEDWDFILRLCDARAPRFVPVILSHYRHHAASPAQLAWAREAWTRILRGRARRPGGHGVELDLPGEPSAWCWSPPAAPALPARGVSVVIPSYEVPELLRSCVERLMATIDPSAVEVIVSDDGSGPETVAEIARLARRFPTLRVDLSGEHRGFTAAANRGLRRARPDHHVVLLNNDAIVTPGWLEALTQVASRHPGVGAVVPRQLLLPGSPTITAHAPYATPFAEADVTLSAHHGNVLPAQVARPDGVIELGFAPFFCVLLTRAARDALGLLDEQRGPHYRSDSVYCAALREVAGLRILYTPHARVYHLLQRATQALRDKDPAGYTRLVAMNRPVSGPRGPWEGA